MIWQPEFTDKTLSRKPGAVHFEHLPRFGERLFKLFYGVFLHCCVSECF
ncbi:AMP nucleosidase [Escherichia coli O118:H16 str. 07-4255]|nr:AMP nucleosidase [Escherichia coli O118:H16 str. 07-4255]